MNLDNVVDYVLEKHEKFIDGQLSLKIDDELLSSSSSRGREALAKRRYMHSLKKFITAFSIGHDSIHLNNIAIALYHLGVHAQKIMPLYNIAIKNGNKKTISLAYNNISIIYKDQNEHSQAEINLRKSLSFNGDNYFANWNLANLLSLINVDLTEEEEKSFDIAINNADFIEHKSSIISDRSWAYYRRGKVEQAIDTVQKSIKLWPDNGNAWNCYGVYMHSKNKKSEALNAWELASTKQKYDQSVVYAFGNMGYLYNQIGDPSNALRYLLISLGYGNYFNHKNIEEYLTTKKKETIETITLLGGSKNSIDVLKKTMKGKSLKRDDISILMFMLNESEDSFDAEIKEMFFDAIADIDDEDFADIEGGRNRLCIDVSSPLTSDSYLLKMSDEGEFETHKFFYERFKRDKKQANIVVPYGRFNIKGNEFFVMRKGGEVDLAQKQREGTLSSDEILRVMELLGYIHGVSIKDKMPMRDSHSRMHYQSRNNKLFINNLADVFGIRFNADEKDGLLCAVGDVSDTLEKCPRAYYKDANLKNFVGFRKGSNALIRAIDFEGNEKKPVFLDVVSALEYYKRPASEEELNHYLNAYVSSLDRHAKGILRRIFSRKNLGMSSSAIEKYYHAAGAIRGLELFGYRCRDIESTKGYMMSQHALVNLDNAVSHFEWFVENGIKVKNIEYAADMLRSISSKL